MKISQLFYPVICLTSLLLAARSAYANLFSVNVAQSTNLQDAPEVSRVKEFQQPSTNAQQLVQSPPTIGTEPEEEITVTGTRTPRLLNNSAGTISIFDIQDLENTFVRDIGDLIRYEPGISVNNRPTRGGNSSFNIRGIEGNRVLIQVDGVRIPDVLGMTNTSRDLVDFDALRRVEIIRGAASTLYGSDAIGGVISFITKDPIDYLNLFGKPVYFSSKVGYSSADSNLRQTYTIAGGDKTLSALLLYTRRDGNETQNRGSLDPNPQTIDGNNVLGKIVFQPNDRTTFKLTGELFDRQTNTNVLSSVGPTVGATILGFNAEDYSRRSRISLAYEYTNPSAAFLQRIRTQIYYQDAETTETVQQLRRVGLSNRQRNSQNQFVQNVLGGDVQFENNFKTGSLDHRLSYGLEIFNTATSRPRDNTEINLATGVINKNVAGELFPNKTFPDTDTLRLGLYLQDEITLANGRLTLIPGIRYDYYKLDPNKNDADFSRINTSNYNVEGFSDSAISPKLGLIFKVTPEVALFAQYARGFRSPPYDDAAIAFTNFAFGYTVLPNADLKPETSNNFEAGVRLNTLRLNAGITGFYNRYSNFIDTVFTRNVLIGGRSFQQFQSQNTSGAEIYGVEAKGEYRFSPRSDGFSLFRALAYAVGNNLESNQPLNSIDPFKAVVGLRYRSPADRWGAELVTTLVAAKDRIDETGGTGIPSSTTVTNLFEPSGYTTLDFLAFYNFNPNVTLNVGVFNLLNQKYFQWSDVRGVSVNDRSLDLYTQPGINVAASLTIRF
ncbi:TonB-dependent hemoglobin/transferrin/lactoferrin family receptor [Phormidesmis sp. 146-33]